MSGVGYETLLAGAIFRRRKQPRILYSISATVSRVWLVGGWLSAGIHRRRTINFGEFTVGRGLMARRRAFALAIAVVLFGLLNRL